LPENRARSEQFRGNRPIVVIASAVPSLGSVIFAAPVRGKSTCRRATSSSRRGPSKLGINGFDLIGRLTLRAMLERHRDELEGRH
jgi:hypothetical protein